MDAVCWRCIEDEYLKEIIREQGAPVECSLCENDEEKAFTVEDLAKILDPIMREHFAQGEDVRKFGEDDKDWWEQEGDPLSFHVQEVIGQDLEFEDEIVEALVVIDPADPRDGEDPFFDDSQNYVPTPVRPYSYYEEWAFVSEDLKHRRRFFSSAAAALFERLFEGVETRKWLNNEKRMDETVVWELPQGSELFRARICNSAAFVKNAHKDPFKHVGPPPPDQARAGRMNVEGVVVFYGAMDCETCLAETRPALGNDTAVITLRTTKPLRLLDFARLGESFSRLSYFQPDFTDQCEKGVFLRRLQSLISQPIVPGRETEYLITQTMAEYLAHVQKKPFDGILFKSVQRSGGTNIVLFPDVQNVFPLAYVDASFTLFSTESIQYTHEQKYVSLIEGEVYIDHESEDEW
jgi:hypothetical protein